MPRPVLVPTMGALHEGHLSLIRIARAESRPVVASIFVNRMQFAPTEDFHRYPRSLARDAKLLDRAGCDMLFAPSQSEMYPDDGSIVVHPPPQLSAILEGEFRECFLAGVCTVVLKLFNMTQPYAAVFGKKDYQQLIVIRNLVRQLSLSIEIIGAETVRESDGLAMSSRNAYLKGAERRRAVLLPSVLRHICAAIEVGRRDWKRLESKAVATLSAAGWKPDYVAIRRQDNLQKPAVKAPIVVLAAAKLGTTRLIDNFEIKAPYGRIHKRP
jgi:pantoate--beta-alanine ligase